MPSQAVLISGLGGFVIGFLVGWYFGRRGPFRACSVGIDNAVCLPFQLKVEVTGTATPDSGTTLDALWALVLDDVNAAFNDDPTLAGAQKFTPAGLPTTDPFPFDLQVPTQPGNTGQDKVVVWSQWHTSSVSPGYNHGSKNYPACTTTTSTSTTRPPTTTSTTRPPTTTSTTQPPTTTTRSP